VADIFEAGIPQEVADVVLAAGEEVVETQDILPLGQKFFAEVRPEKAGAAGDENPLHIACPSREKNNTVGSFHSCLQHSRRFVFLVFPL
jgi:hypothetical protein